MSNFTVLLVDDEKAFLDILLKRLKKRGLTTFEAYDGKQALETVRKQAIDVVVLDVRLPDIGGIEILREIKNISASIEVVMLTGHASVEVAIKGIESGAFDYLIKPIDVDELFYKLEDAFRRKKLREAETNRTTADYL